MEWVAAIQLAVVNEDIWRPPFEVQLCLGAFGYYDTDHVTFIERVKLVGIVFTMSSRNSANILKNDIKY